MERYFAELISGTGVQHNWWSIVVCCFIIHSFVALGMVNSMFVLYVRFATLNPSHIYLFSRCFKLHQTLTENIEWSAGEVTCDPECHNAALSAYVIICHVSHLRSKLIVLHLVPKCSSACLQLKIKENTMQNGNQMLSSTIYARLWSIAANTNCTLLLKSMILLRVCSETRTYSVTQEDGQSTHASTSTVSMRNSGNLNDNHWTVQPLRKNHNHHRITNQPAKPSELNNPFM